MKKTDIKALKMLADLLPQTYYEVPVQISGKALIEKGVKTDGSGNKVDEKLYYQLTQKHPVNHNRRIRKVYEKDGQKGVEEYCQNVKDLAAESAKGISSLNETMNERKSCLI
jgi:hypothetical protein